MLTMAEVNARLKENFQAQLQDVRDLPEDLARGYKAWIRGLVAQASQKIKAEAAPPQTDEGQEAQQ